ncbi:hypothetical protein C809_03091 [Lachnospiraceae bacterium MD335]|nr:hypothetical protein C809_03091 [Lachnospiraceae bacterium MD335]
MTKEQALKKFANELQIAKDAIEEGYTFDRAVEIASEDIADIDINGEYFFDLCCEEIDGFYSAYKSIKKYGGENT